MARRAFRDLSSPDTQHRVTLDGTALEFDQEGLLKDPRVDQVAVMEGDPYRRQRFVEADLAPGRVRSPRTPAGGGSPSSPAGNKPTGNAGTGTTEEATDKP